MLSRTATWSISGSTCKMTELERLAAYDRLYQDLLRERDKVLADMERLRAAGRNRGATYQQLMAQKLTVQNLIGRFALYGICEEPK